MDRSFSAMDVTHPVNIGLMDAQKTIQYSTELVMVGDGFHGFAWEDRVFVKIGEVDQLPAIGLSGLIETSVWGGILGRHLTVTRHVDLEFAPAGRFEFTI